MRWYKFVINFQMFLAAIVNVANAGYYFWGLNYGENAELVYMLWVSPGTGYIYGSGNAGACGIMHLCPGKAAQIQEKCCAHLSFGHHHKYTL